MMKTKVLYILSIWIFVFSTNSFSLGINKDQRDEDPITVEVMDKWLAIDVSSSTVVKKLGEPERKTKIVLEEATGDYIQIWEYNRKGIALKMGSKAKDKLMVVKSITVKKPYSKGTSKNIRIGSDIKKAKEKYAVMIDKTTSGSSQIVVGNIYWGTIFFMSNGKVYKIFIGAAAE